MLSSRQLSPPGDSTYSSDTLNVGDGTWDTQRNTFLLPNLMGLNFETMRYNGMGNRFRDMAGYHPLVRAHGVIAAITFLGIVPIAIMIARFYHPRPYWALRLHIWLQVLTVFLSTVIFVVGWFAVGPRRSLTNPHHGIGLAIYVMIIAQTFWGWFVHKRTKGERLLYIPMKLMLHQWLGRAVALLGIVQIGLGLTLYGSPLALFVLYALAVFALLLVYFVLTFLRERRWGSDYDGPSDYMSGPEVVDDQRGHSNLGRVAAAGVAGGGLAALGSRFRRRSRSRSPVDGDSERTPQSIVHEKHSEDGRHGGRWGKRILQVGAMAGAAGLAKKFFDRRRGHDSDTESGHYRPAHTRSDSLYDDSLSRVEEGRPGPSHPRPYDGAPSMYTDSAYTYRDDRGHGVRDAAVGGGVFAALKGLFKGRRDKKEQDRIEEIRRADVEAERVTRDGQRRFTGDGLPRRSMRRQPSISVVTGPTDPDTAIPPEPPSHQEFSGTESVTTTGRRQPRYPSLGPAGAAGSSRRRRSGGREESVDSQPYSIKVKMHNGGRHVTLRRLTEEESRRSKRRENRRSSRRRQGSASSLSGHEGNNHWRRVEDMERQQQEDMERNAAVSTVGPDASTVAPASIPAAILPSAAPSVQPSVPTSAPAPTPTPTQLPPPPPIPSGFGNIHSPISTDLSSHASKRDRRRAERRTQSRQGRHHNVEFT
ncbi:hypothetical protein AJ80_02663 [Polytolypa hystricis UAMH7299]|uniref:Cytochrome b561 domain-containing protein n=1 Tax=Polytolypa hystricis (strain UAMH7299) TaxID=1447883 RepID=A0A2B7YRK3_POLH7|nr:hypothetical protein AJ80_02663 [Polytolypa hystricis UAMH7299]